MESLKKYTAEQERQAKKDLESHPLPKVVYRKDDIILLGSKHFRDEREILPERRPIYPIVGLYDNFYNYAKNRFMKSGIYKYNSFSVKPRWESNVTFFITSKSFKQAFTMAHGYLPITGMDKPFYIIITLFEPFSNAISFNPRDIKIVIESLAENHPNIDFDDMEHIFIK